MGFNSGFKGLKAKTILSGLGWYSVFSAGNEIKTNTSMAKIQIVFPH